MKTVKELYDKAEQEGGIFELFCGYGLPASDLEGELAVLRPLVDDLQTVWNELEDALGKLGYGEEE